MHLVLRGKVRLAGLHALPRLDVSVGGQWATSTTVDSDGNFLVDAAVPDASGWTDVFVVFSTIGTPEKQVRDLRIAPLMELTWEPKR